MQPDGQPDLLLPHPRQQLLWGLEARRPGRVLMEAPKTSSPSPSPGTEEPPVLPGFLYKATWGAGLGACRSEPWPAAGEGSSAARVCLNIGCPLGAYQLLGTE